MFRVRDQRIAIGGGLAGMALATSLMIGSWPRETTVTVKALHPVLLGEASFTAEGGRTWRIDAALEDRSFLPGATYRVNHYGAIPLPRAHPKIRRAELIWTPGDFVARTLKDIAPEMRAGILERIKKDLARPDLDPKP